jgi:hypothetical protein
MGRQSGIIPLQATMDNMTFYKSKHDGMLVKKQSKIPKERIQNDPNFAKLRKNNIEFTNASKACKLLRKAVNAVILGVADGRSVSRLMSTMVLAAKADTTNPRGKRNVTDGDLQLLEGFNFNKNTDMTAILKAEFQHSIDRVTGELKVSIPALDLVSELVAPKEATHFKVISAGAELDFPNNLSKTEKYAGPFIALDSHTTTAIDIVHQLPANSVHPLLLLLGVTFFTNLNGDYEPTGGLEFNALSIVEVSTV